MASIIISTAKVMMQQTKYPTRIVRRDPSTIPAPMVFEKKTLASWEWARESAQRRRYDAVCEIPPSTNSIV